MSPPVVTGLYASLLAFVQSALTVYVGNSRGPLGVALGDGSREQVLDLLARHGTPADILKDKSLANAFDSKYFDLLRRVRAHSNFVEMTWPFVVLCGLAESNGAPRRLMHIALSTFLSLRLFHIYGMASHPNALGTGRLVSTVSSNLMTLAMGACNVYLYLKS